jgi:peptidyl-prolyl cis-trans isomerase SurA
LAQAAGERDLSRRATKRNEVLHQILELMIGERLMDAAVKELNLDVSDQDVDTAIEEVKKSHNLDQQKLEEAIRNEGLTMPKYRDVVRAQVARLKLIQQKVRSRVKVTEQDLKSEYEKYVRLQQDDPEVHARHIAVQVPVDATPEEARQRGVDFAALAKRKSEGSSAPQGGDLGHFKRGVMLPEFERVAFRLKEGEISDPVRTQFGWHVIKVEEIRGATIKKYEEVKEFLREQLSRNQLDKATQAYVQELRQAAVVDVKI